MGFSMLMTIPIVMMSMMTVLLLRCLLLMLMLLIVLCCCLLGDWVDVCVVICIADSNTDVVVTIIV